MAHTPAQIAAAYAALKTHRRCVYVGGGKIQVVALGGTGFSAPARYITTTEALAAVRRAGGAA